MYALVAASALAPAELRERGVEFEHYQHIGDGDLEGDLHIDGNMKMAWFKDPDGNIIAMVSEEHEEE